MEELSKTTVELMRVLAATAKCATTEEIMKLTGLPKETVESYLEVLRQQGFISANKEGRHCSLNDVKMLQDKFRLCEKCYT